MNNILTFLLFLIFLASCDVVNVFGENNDESTTKPSTNCVAGVPLPLSTKFLPKKRTEKIYLKNESFSLSKKKHLKKNLRMMTVFDVACVRSRGTFVFDDAQLDLKVGVLNQLPFKKMSMPRYATSLKTKSTYDYEKFSQLVNQDPCILSVSNYIPIKTSAVPNDPSFTDAEHLDYLRAPTAWDVFYHATTGITQDVVLAVIDTGGDFDHPDLIANVWTNPGEVPGNATDDDGNGFVDDIHGYNFVTNIADPSPEPPPTGDTDHGTNVAGIAAARMDNNIGAAGIMGLNVRIMHLNIAGPNQTLDPNELINAINYATDNGADIINLSLGIGNADLTAVQPITDAIENAVANNVTVVAGAGNDGQLQTDSTYFYPGTPLGAQMEGVINVGAFDTTSGRISTFSNFSDSFVEIIAPGSEDSTLAQGLFMPDPGSDPVNSYDDASGTSFAAPIVAGAVGLIIGLMRSRGQNPTPAQVETVLKDNSVSDSLYSGLIQDCRSLDLTTLANGI